MSISKLELTYKLKKKKFRDKFKLFIAEGLRLCEEVPVDLIKFGFFTKDFLRGKRENSFVDRLRKMTILEEISSRSMRKISETQTSQGILLVGFQIFSNINEIINRKTIIVLDRIQDPGNLGTILRTAEAFNCAVILLNNSVELFNPKVIRSSMGMIFQVPIADMPREIFLATMKSYNYEILSTVTDLNSEIYFQHNFKEKIAVIFGNEANGISKDILNQTSKIFIPMSKQVESLNVAVSVSIIVSEIYRQFDLKIH